MLIEEAEVYGLTCNNCRSKSSIAAQLYQQGFSSSRLRQLGVSTGVIQRFTEDSNSVLTTSPMGLADSFMASTYPLRVNVTRATEQLHITEHPQSIIRTDMQQNISVMQPMNTFRFDMSG